MLIYSGRFLFLVMLLLGFGCSGMTPNDQVDTPPSAHDPLLNEMLLERDKTQQAVNDFALLQKDRYVAGEISKEEMRTLIDTKYKLEKEKLSETLRRLEEQAQ